MKPLAEGKSRLAGAIPDEKRRLLSAGLLLRVLRAAATCAEIEDVWVYGGDELARVACARTGAAWREDPSIGLNGCMALAFSDAEDDGINSAIFLPADLPLITSTKLSRFIKAGAGAAVAIAPDEIGDGTNALAIELGSGFRTKLGQSSFALHLEQARELEIVPLIYRTEEFGLDVDTPADIARLAEISPNIWSDLRHEIEDARLADVFPVSEGK